MARSAFILTMSLASSLAAPIALASGKEADAGPNPFCVEVAGSFGTPELAVGQMPSGSEQQRHSGCRLRHPSTSSVHEERHTAQLELISKNDDDLISIERDNVTRVFLLSPGSANSPDVTHSALLVTRENYSGHLSFGGRVQTVKQLRVGSPPNDWECAWLVWNYEDDEHFYYLAIKPTGWEIGKRDPAYPGGQRFLVSGHDAFPIGTWHRFMIHQENNLITALVNDVAIASYADTERPYLAGKLGLYTEDAEVQIDDITAPFSENFESYPPSTYDTDGHTMNNWLLPFLGYGHAAIGDRQK